MDNASLIVTERFDTREEALEYAAKLPFWARPLVTAVVQGSEVKWFMPSYMAAPQ